MEWMNEVSEFICEYFKSTSTRAVTRVYGNNAGSAYALRKRAHFVVRAFKEVKAEMCIRDSGTTGVALALLMRLKDKYGTVEEDELLGRISE